jgi:hypothetical protein
VAPGRRLDSRLHGCRRDDRGRRHGGGLHRRRCRSRGRRGGGAGGTTGDGPKGRGGGRAGERTGVGVTGGIGAGVTGGAPRRRRRRPDGRHARDGPPRRALGGAAGAGRAAPRARARVPARARHGLRRRRGEAAGHGAGDRRRALGLGGHRGGELRADRLGLWPCAAAGAIGSGSLDCGLRGGRPGRCHGGDGWARVRLGLARSGRDGLGPARGPPGSAATGRSPASAATGSRSLRFGRHRLGLARSATGSGRPLAPARARAPLRPPPARLGALRPPPGSGLGPPAWPAATGLGLRLRLRPPRRARLGLGLDRHHRLGSPVPPRRPGSGSGSTAATGRVGLGLPPLRLGSTAPPARAGLRPAPRLGSARRLGLDRHRRPGRARARPPRPARARPQPAPAPARVRVPARAPGSAPAPARAAARSPRPGRPRTSRPCRRRPRPPRPRACRPIPGTGRSSRRTRPCPRSCARSCRRRSLSQSPWSCEGRAEDRRVWVPSGSDPDGAPRMADGPTRAPGRAHART